MSYDGDLAREHHYVFAHQMLPDFLEWPGSLADVLNAAGFDPVLHRIWDQVGEKLAPSERLPVAGLTSELVEVGGVPGALITLPPAEHWNEAYAALIVPLDPPKERRIFMLERQLATGSGDPGTMICQWADGRHANFGPGPLGTDTETFVDRVSRIVAPQPKPAAKPVVAVRPKPYEKPATKPIVVGRPTPVQKPPAPAPPPKPPPVQKPPAPAPPPKPPPVQKPPAPAPPPKPPPETTRSWWQKYRWILAGIVAIIAIVLSVVVPQMLNDRAPYRSGSDYEDQGRCLTAEGEYAPCGDSSADYKVSKVTQWSDCPGEYFRDSTNDDLKYCVDEVDWLSVPSDDPDDWKSEVGKCLTDDGDEIGCTVAEAKFQIRLVVTDDSRCYADEFDGDIFYEEDQEIIQYCTSTSIDPSQEP